MSVELLPELELGAALLGAALLPEALLGWSLLEDELDALGVAAEPELGVDEDELELDGALGVVVTEPDMELEPDAGGVLELPEDDEDDGVDGVVVLEEDEPADDLSVERDAPGPPAPLSQP